MKKSKDKLRQYVINLVVSILALLILFVALYTNSLIGVPKHSIIQDTRDSQRINNDWLVTQTTTSNISALLFYDDLKAEGVFSIYVNHRGMSFGYFFRDGGDFPGNGNEILEYQIEGYDERAYVSMNKSLISKVEIDNGNLVKTIDIDNTQPFTLVLSKEKGAITFFDISGNKVIPVKIIL